MPNTFFTSDTHFGHKHILEYCPNRPFQTVDEMDEGIIRVWNDNVQDGDDIYHLGDVAFMGTTKLIDIFKRLNGNIHIIKGNHDSYKQLKRLESDGLIESFSNYKEIEINAQRIVLFHFPIAVWHKNHRGSWNLHGHSHGDYSAIGKQLDVGVDGPLSNGCKPVSFDEIKEYMSTREIVILDHHESTNE